MKERTSPAAPAIIRIKPTVSMLTPSTLRSVA